jgi:putative ABC transport system permease protein
VTGGYAASEGWPAALPAVVLAGGVLVAVAAGGLAGLYPALRAARLSPTEALRRA